MVRRFETIFSVELSEELYERAKQKFSRHSHIHLYQGNSAHVLPEILRRVSEPALFWLDAHASGGITSRGEKVTPIREELQHIFDHMIEDHVVLIDDARGFIGENDYPSLEELADLVSQSRPHWAVEVEADIIMLYPADWRRR